MDQVHRLRRFLGFTTAAGVAVVLGSLGVLAPAQSARAAEKQVDFNRDIKPIFADSCVKCHSLNNPRHKAASGLRLDNKAGAMKGGEDGKDIIPGNAKDSLLYKLLLGPAKVDGDDVDAMPKQKKGEEFKPLPQEKIELIKEWIDQGAKWSK